MKNGKEISRLQIENVHLKQALKKAEEALHVAAMALGKKPIARSVVTEALAAIEDIGKE